MTDSIIQVKNLSKSYIISHEGKEHYTALRDVMAQKTKNLFSFLKPSQGSAVSKEEFWALKDINFNIKQGDRVGIIGRNGAGKSTLLKILSRITEPSTGEIKVKGRIASLLEVGTGFHPELTGRENIFLNGAILGMRRNEIKQKFDEIVDFAEIEKFLDTPVKRYSSGMYVRLAFAVAAHLEPEILVIDEVLAVGDTQFQKKCLGKMEDVSKNEGRTVLFVSHQLGTIARLCNKTILLRNGHLIDFGSTDAVIENYLTNQQSTYGNIYLSNTETKKKEDIYLAEAFTVNAKNEIAEEFGFNESITVRSKINTGSGFSGVKFGITLLNIHGSYIATNIIEINTDDIKNVITELDFTFPPSLIAPNTYSFRFALFQNNKVYEILESICRVKIIDTGTHLSSYEGINYGSVIFENNWKFK
jgi:lipopolysaccharide transport system ATP-binding protein